MEGLNSVLIVAIILYLTIRHINMNGWMSDMDEYIKAMLGLDHDDITEPVDISDETDDGFDM